jgi:16S rRNA (uracil1498-N3)-methyltransferase
MSESAHVFAFHLPALSTLCVMSKPGHLLHFKHQDLWHRITRVLRLKTDDPFILFDEKIHVECLMREETLIKKHIISASITKIHGNKPATPSLTLALGLVKRATLADILYSATQMGVSKIIPLLTTKSSREWGGSKEMEKLTSIAISAAEQSKNYCLPSLEQPEHFLSFINNAKQSDKIKRVYFMPNGAPLFHLLQDIHTKAYEEIILVIGPEGGFTSEEEETLRNAGYATHVLIPHILRSIDAALLAIGVIRSIARD